MKSRIHISSVQTGMLKYMPLFIMPIWILIEILTGNSEGTVIPIAFLLINGVINYFVVDASVDAEYIYIKQWIKQVRYPLNQLDKIGELKDGVTRVTLKGEKGNVKDFVILNVRNSFYTHDSKNVYELLLKLKMNFLKIQRDSIVK